MRLKGAKPEEGKTTGLKLAKATGLGHKYLKRPNS